MSDNAMKLIKKALTEGIIIIVSGDKLELYQLEGRARPALGSEIYNRAREVVPIVKKQGSQHSSGNTVLLCSEEQLHSVED